MRKSAVLFVSILLAACGAQSDEDQAKGVAERFYQAMAKNDGQTMCELLAPQSNSWLYHCENGSFPNISEDDQGHAAAALKAGIFESAVKGMGRLCFVARPGYEDYNWSALILENVGGRWLGTEWNPSHRCEN